MYFSENFSEIIQLQQNLMNESYPSNMNAQSKRFIQNLKIIILSIIIIIGVIGRQNILLDFLGLHKRRNSGTEFLFTKILQNISPRNI